MKKFFVFIISIIILSLNAKTLDKIVARIGDEIILQSELNQAIEQMKRFGNKSATDLDVLNAIIDSKLIIQKAKEDGYSVDEYKLKQKSEEYINSIISRYKNIDEFYKELHDAGLTVSELKKQFEISEKEKSLREQIIRSEITNKIHITEAEIQDYYEEIKSTIPIREEKDKIGMIMKIVKPSEETKKKSFIEISNIIEKLNNGADFAELAKKESDCGSAKNGGDLGWVEKGMMVKPFEDAAFALQVGEISNVVETEFGYHVIKVYEKRNNEIKVSHILKKVEPSNLDIEATKKLMNNVIDKYRNGADFAELARQYSDDDSTAVRGGVIGEFSEKEYPEMFKDYISNLNYGECSDLISMGDVYYIFAKLEKIPARKYTYNELYNELKSQLQSKKEEEMYNELIIKLKKESFVEILLD